MSTRHAATARRAGGRRLLLAGLAVAAGVACWSVPEADRAVIRPWLLCSDCGDDALARVTDLGPRAERYLRAALLDGPTAADDSVVRLRVTEAVARARRYRTERGITDTLSSADSGSAVLQQLDDFRLRYRLRAAQALGTIDPRADSIAVRAFCADSVPELVRRPEYRALFRPFGDCP